VIRLRRAALPTELSEELAKRTGHLVQTAADGAAAREQWKSARSCRSGLRRLLSHMASGIDRCMYCGDSLGTDIDHFEPLFISPLRAFEWSNHFLACSHCNSHEKRERFPRDEDGTALLVDPAKEDPSEHMLLVLSTGEYEALTPQGEATIKVFGLNRTALSRGRRSAFVITRSVLLTYLRLYGDGLTDEAMETAAELEYQPFADVREAMRWTRRNIAPENAELILGGPDVIRALDLLPIDVRSWP
jgi:hypothetical protein